MCLLHGPYERHNLKIKLVALAVVRDRLERMNVSMSRIFGTMQRECRWVHLLMKYTANKVPTAWESLIPLASELELFYVLRSGAQILCIAYLSSTGSK